MSELESRLRKAVERFEKRDKDLAKEMKSVRARGPVDLEALRPAGSLESYRTGGTAVGAPHTLETIVLRQGRPVLAIADDEVVLEFREVESEVWKQRLIDAKDRILPAFVRSLGSSSRIIQDSIGSERDG